MKHLLRVFYLGLLSLTLLASTLLSEITLGETNKYNFLLMRCRTEGDLLLSSSVASFTTPKEGELDFYWYAEFTCVWNSTSTVDIELEWAGNKTETRFEFSKVMIITADFFINESMNLISFWDNPYRSEVPINITNEQTFHKARYFVNLSTPLQEARQKFLNELNLSSQTKMDRIGGRLSFRADNLDCLSKDNRIELLTFTFISEKANIFVLHVEAIISTDAELLQAEIGENAMERRLNAITGSAFLEPGSLKSCTTEVQWLLPKIPDWWNIPPWMWLIPSFIGGLLSPTIIWMGRKIWHSKLIHTLKFKWRYWRLQSYAKRRKHK